jgi:hypothetical protein
MVTLPWRFSRTEVGARWSQPACAAWGRSACRDRSKRPAKVGVAFAGASVVPRPSRHRRTWIQGAVCICLPSPHAPSRVGLPRLDTASRITAKRSASEGNDNLTACATRSQGRCRKRSAPRKAEPNTRSFAMLNLCAARCMAMRSSLREQMMRTPPFGEVPDFEQRYWLSIGLWRHGRPVSSGHQDLHQSSSCQALRCAWLQLARDARNPSAAGHLAMTGVLVDTSVWVEHFRKHNGALTKLLESAMVLTHPMVLGELACGAASASANTG